MSTLVGLLGVSEAATEAAASLLSKFCSSGQHQIAAASGGGGAASSGQEQDVKLTSTLASTLLSCKQECSQLSVLDALIAFTRTSDAACKCVARVQHADAAARSPLGYLIRLLRSSGSNQLSVRLASCIANVFAWKRREAAHPGSGESAAPFAARRQVIIAVLALMKDPETQLKAADVFAQVVEDDGELQELLCTLDTLKCIMLYFAEKEVGAGGYTRGALAELRGRGLNVMAAFMTSCSTARFDVMLSQTLMQEIKLGLCAEDSEPVALAACRCVLSLSRSVKALRTKLVENNIMKSVAALLEDSSSSSSERVKEVATAGICNMLLEFSPQRKDGVALGVIEKLAANLVGSTNSEELRVNSAWALENVLYSIRSDKDADEIRNAVSSALPWSALASLLDEDGALQVHAAGIFQNLVYGKAPAIINNAAAGFGGTQELVNVVEKLLAKGVETRKPDLVLRALYVVANIAAEGEIEHKDALVNNRKLVAMIVEALVNPQKRIQVPALWFLNNLVRDGTAGRTERRGKLWTGILPSRLDYLAQPSNLESVDVRHLATMTLESFQILD